MVEADEEEHEETSKSRLSEPSREDFDDKLSYFREQFDSKELYVGLGDFENSESNRRAEGGCEFNE